MWQHGRCSWLHRSGSACGAQAAWHLLYAFDGRAFAHVFACEKHRRKVSRAIRAERAHTIGADCGMPGSGLYLPENVCRCVELPVAEPVRALAVCV